MGCGVAAYLAAHKRSGAAQRALPGPMIVDTHS